MLVRKYRDSRTGMWFLRWRVNGRANSQYLHVRDKPVAEELRKAKERELALAGCKEQLDAVIRERVDAALRFALEWILPGRSILPSPLRPLSVDQALEEFVTFHRVKGNSKTHIDNIKRQIKMFLTFCEIRNVAEIERRHLEAYLAHARGEGQGDKSVRDKYIIIAAWLKWAKAGGYIASNPAEGLMPKKPAREDVRYFSAGEVEAILAKAEGKDPRLAALVATAIYAGLRREEIMRLEWEDIDLEGRCIRVRNKPGRPTKTRRARTVPILDQLLPLLHRLPRGGGRVFPWRDRRHVSRKVTTLCEQANVADGGLQNARHTCATWLLANGVSTRVVAQWLGHSVAVLESCYAGILPLGIPRVQMTFRERQREPQELPYDRGGQSGERSKTDQAPQVSP